MTVSVSCKGCKSSLKVPEQFAGKKIKCPKCAGIVAVPALDEEEFVAVEAMPQERIKKAVKRTAITTRRDDDDEDDEEIVRRRTRIKAAPERVREREVERRSRFREEDDEDRRSRRVRRDEEEDDRGKKSNYKPCPNCGARKARKVLWTVWGSFYGPALFTHVRCPECSTCYNGRTGRSNALAATIFVSVPLLGISAILGAVFFMLRQRGYL